MKKTILLLIITMLLALHGFAQESQEEGLEERKIHTLALVFGYTHIPSAYVDGHSRSSINAPTIGLDYFLQVSEKWKIGIVTDLEFEKYYVDFNEEELERERALVTGILVGYEFAKRWSILLGPGVEFEKNRNLFILRSSIEYEFELGNNWGLAPVFNYDFKKEYSTYSLGITLGKAF